MVLSAMLVHTCNPKTWEVEARGSGIFKADLSYTDIFKASLDYMKP